jgi:hypothetical protein
MMSSLLKIDVILVIERSVKHMTIIKKFKRYFFIGIMIYFIFVLITAGLKLISFTDILKSSMTAIFTALALYFLEGLAKDDLKNKGEKLKNNVKEMIQ